MSAIPKGWRKLRAGAVLRNGDRYQSPYEKGWLRSIGAGHAYFYTYIRRITKKVKSTNKPNKT